MPSTEIIYAPLHLVQDEVADVVPNGGLLEAMKEGRRRAECHEPRRAGRFVCFVPRPVPSAHPAGNAPSLVAVVQIDRPRRIIGWHAVSNTSASTWSYIWVLVRPRKRRRHSRRFARAAPTAHEDHIGPAQCLGQPVRQGPFLLRTGTRDRQLVNGWKEREVTWLSAPAPLPREQYITPRSPYKRGAVADAPSTS